MEKMEVSPEKLMGEKGNSDETDAKSQPAGPETELPSFAFQPIDRDSVKYNMNHPKRGKALLINHEEFAPHLKCFSREGTKKDTDDLNKQLGELNFEVTVLNDPKVGELITTITTLADEDHSDSDCLLIVIMTHGKDGVLYAYDGGYQFDWIWSCFTSDRCPTLAGKPKLFFIQACRGNRLDHGTRMLCNGEDGCDGPGDVSYTIPTHADFMIAYSTMQGFTSFRDPESGSWFIQALCQVLAQQSREEDLLSIMTTVSRIVAIGFESNTPQDSNTHQRKQIPCITSSLTRKVYFPKKT